MYLHLPGHVRLLDRREAGEGYAASLLEQFRQVVLVDAQLFCCLAQGFSVVWVGQRIALGLLYQQVLTCRGFGLPLPLFYGLQRGAEIGFRLFGQRLGAI